ncbi:MAG TPA: alginate export family protein [Tepidisphaeraceae bacterium]|nr:alginate export family protein [Tepidisphaeraceae bacterium]
MRRLVPLALVAIALASPAPPALAQSERQRFERTLEQMRTQTLDRIAPDVPADQRVVFDYGMYAIFDYLSVDDNRNENHVLRQYSLVPYARLNLDNVHEVLIRGRLTYRDFNDGDSFDNRGDELVDPDVDRLYYKFDLARSAAAYNGTTLPYNLTLVAGRDFVYWGNGLVLGTTLDGVSVGASIGPLSVGVVAGVTPVRTVDFDSSRPAFDYNTRRGFYGAIATLTAGTHRPFVYGLVQRDYNDDDRLNQGNVVTEYQYDSWYVGFGSTGSFTDRLTYGAEVVYEGGRGKSNSFELTPPFLTPVDPTRDPIGAWAADVRLDYLFTDARRSRVGVEFLIASGDSDRFHTSNTFGGNRTGTTDRSFNGFGLVNTGLAFAPDVSNVMMFRVGASTFPLPDQRATRLLQVGADLFVYGKTDRDGAFSETTGDSRYLGWEPDVYMNWQVTSDVSLALRYGVFFPSADAFPDDTARQFFSLTLTFSL